MRQIQSKVRKSNNRGLISSVQPMRAGRVSERVERGLTEIQRKVIRHMVNQPGKTLKEYADAVCLDRSAVSRWVHHDPAFQAALEEARSAPRPAMTAEEIFDALDAMNAEERRKIATALGGDGRFGLISAIGSGIIEIDNLERRIRDEPDLGEQERLFPKIFELFCLAGALFHRKGFDSDGRLVDAKGVLSRLIDEDEEEMELCHTVMLYKYRAEHPVEMQSREGGDPLGGRESTEESRAPLYEQGRGFEESDNGKRIAVRVQDIKERREILETSYQAKDSEEAPEGDDGKKSSVMNWPRKDGKRRTQTPAASARAPVTAEGAR